MPVPTTIRLRDATSARHAYRRADVPAMADVQGDWTVDFLGNDAFLDLHAKARKVLGIGKLFGLRFDGRRVVHLTGKPRKLTEVKPLTVAPGESAIDGRPCLVLRSEPENGALWSQIRTEIRQLDATTMIGVDLVGPARVTIPLPFRMRRHHGKSSR